MVQIVVAVLTMDSGNLVLDTAHESIPCYIGDTMVFAACFHILPEVEVRILPSICTWDRDRQGRDVGPGTRKAITIVDLVDER